jgi:hypothetical protein
MEGGQPQRGDVPAALLPPATPGRDPGDPAGALVHRALVEGLRLRGTAVWVAPDFGFWTEDGRLALVDWKTGGGRGDGASFQLGCYALYAHEVLGVAPRQTDLVEVNLRAPTVTAHRWDDDRLQAVREQLRLSIRAMKAYLADPDANLASIDGFERTEELRICRWCNFRAVCRPELGAEAATELDRSGARS